MSLGGTGLRDWLIQRYTAVYLVLFTIFLFVFFIRHPDLAFDDWQGLFSHFSMQIGTLFALICIVFHAWIGLWTILTDYIKPVFLRYFLQGIILLALFGYVVWGILILWGM